MDTVVWLKIHLFAVAFWLGVVAVEFVLEQNRAKSHGARLAVARYHAVIDLFIELPAFSLAAISGIALIDWGTPLGWYWIKPTLGAIAVAGNVLCLAPVLWRREAARRGDLEKVVAYSKTIDRISLLAVPAGLTALLLALLSR